MSNTGMIANSSVSPDKVVTSVLVLFEGTDPFPDPPEVIQVRGFYLSGTTQVQYVLEQFTLGPLEVISRTYNTTGFKAFAFEFLTLTPVIQFPLITVWGKNAAGDIIGSYRILDSELTFEPYGF